MALGRKAVVIGGVVVNVIMADDTFTVPAPASIVAAPDTVGPGWTYNGSAFSAPVVATPVWEVRKLVVVNRIIAAGQATAFKGLLAGLGDADALRWQGCVTVFNNEPTALAICAALSLDPAVIMRAGDAV